MLMPAQVRAFLQHEDSTVRHFACNYLAKAHDAGGATAEDVWAAIDRRGEGAEYEWLRPHAADFKQTEASLERALEEWRKATDDKPSWQIERLLRACDVDVLRARRDAVLGLAGMPGRLRNYLEARMAEVSEPPERLWEQFMAACAALEDWDARKEEEEDTEADEEDQKTERQRLVDDIEVMVERLARQGDFAGPGCIAILSDPEILDWREVYAIKLVERMRYSPAMELLIDRVGCDGDYASEGAVDALTALGSVEVVEAVARRFPTERWDYQLFATGVLERIKRPESETAALRLMEGPGLKENVRGYLAGALCRLCPTAGLEAVERVVEAGDYDETFSDLVDDLAVACVVAGDAARAERWKAVADQERAAQAERRQRSMRESMQRWVENGEVFDLQQLGDVQDGYRAATPYVRPTVKVGRNDPCPCGSGKKYKKCCGG